MTTITMPVQVPVTRVRTTTAPTGLARPVGDGLRLTARGRVVVAVLAALVGTLGVLGGQRADAGTAPAAVPVVTHTVAAGESLWAIAAGLTPAGGDVRDTVAALVALNELTGSSLAAGQQILLPARS